MTIEDIQKLMELMTKFEVDFLEFENLKLSKSRHETQSPLFANDEPPKVEEQNEEEEEDELLFHSSKF